ncbi:MAG: DUF3800 domain-containing protein [Elusimicrobiota bacterium]|jgi:hypothetical protein|nr:DUF3800 domain-containing protein [Elusimicrobiota bacterium]
MYVFIDEAGDTGFKISSSRHFVIALIIFDNEEDINKVDLTIAKQRIKDNIFPEYKSFKTSIKHKNNFFDCIKLLDFTISYIVVDKITIKNIELRNNPQNFYSFFLQMILNNAPLNNASIKIDEMSGKKSQRELQNFLNKNICEGKIKSLKFVNSKNNHLIQLADMIAGVLFGHYQKQKKNNEKYEKVFKDKIVKKIIIK